MTTPSPSSAVRGPRKHRVSELLLILLAVVISAGAYGWPREEAIRTAVDTLRGTATSVETATLVLFDADTLRLARQLSG